MTISFIEICHRRPPNVHCEIPRVGSDLMSPPEVDIIVRFIRLNVSNDHH